MQLRPKVLGLFRSFFTTFLTAFNDDKVDQMSEPTGKDLP